jgi:hypothetical protein
MLYAGFVCQQEHVKFYDLEDISYLRLRSVTVSKLLCGICRLICQISIVPNPMSLHMSIVVSTTMLESVCQLICQVQYLPICQMIYPICYELYAGCHMPRLVCRFLYVVYRMLVSYYKFTVKSAYMPISVPVYACSIIDLICQL